MTLTSDPRPPPDERREAAEAATHRHLVQAPV